MSKVREFHEAFGLDAPDYPVVPEPDLVRLRVKLIREEYTEVMEELGRLIYAKTTEEALEIMRRLLKELADLRYVTEGAAVAFGLDIEGAFQETHRSNMSKLGADGRPIYREDGKVLKGPGYKPADMDKFIPRTLENE